MKNYSGALFKINNKDYFFGGVTSIDDIIILPSGDWYAYQAEEERQFRGMVETMACGAFATLNVLERICNYYLLTDRIPESYLVWFKEKGYIRNNRFNFSDRFTSIMSETTINGNYDYKVGDSVRDDGVIPETMLPFGNPSNFAEYQNKNLITDEMIAMGKEWKKRMTVLYERVRPEDIKEALKRSPLIVLVYAWIKNDQGEYINRGSLYNHFVELYSPADRIFDSYNPFNKKLIDGYVYKTALKYSVTFNPMPTLTLKNNCRVRNADTGKRGLHLDGKLLVGSDKDIEQTWTDRSDDFNNKVTITGAEWDKFEKRDIKNPSQPV